MYDRSYDELSVGDRRSYGGITLTETHVVIFAGVTGDFNPKHMDAAHCATTPLGERIPHGLLMLSAALGRVPIDPACVLRFLGLDEVRFHAAPRIGDTVRPTVEVLDKADEGGGGRVITGLDINDQAGRLLATAKLTMIFAGRPPGGGARQPDSSIAAADPAAGGPV